MGIAKQELARAEAERKALVKCVDILWKFPGVRQDCWAWLDELVQQRMRMDSGTASDALWPAACNVAGNVAISCLKVLQAAF